MSLTQLRKSRHARPADELTRFLPTTREEMRARGLDELDILIVTGDAYVDHPAFGPIRHEVPMSATTAATNGSGHTISTLAELKARYGEASGAAVAKELDHIAPHYRLMIEASPFMALATVGEGGLDCTPRGDPAGFVRVRDDKTVMIPDRRGNNRIDSLRNIIEDPRVALLFLIPGIGETLRINGRAEISVDPDLLESFAMNGKQPRSVLIVTVERIYFQCSKAIVRSKLWDPATQIPRSALPSIGTMVHAMSKGAIDGAAYDSELPARITQQLY